MEFVYSALLLCSQKIGKRASWGNCLNTITPEFCLSKVNCCDLPWNGTEHGCNHNAVISHTLKIHGVPAVAKTYRLDYYY